MMIPKRSEWLHGRWLMLFHPAGTPQPTRFERAVAHVYNATRLVIWIDPGFARDLMARNLLRRAVPLRYCYAHRSLDRHAELYAVPPLHWLLRFWNRIGGRWCLHRLGLWLGVLELKEGGYYRNARPRWPKR